MNVELQELLKAVGENAELDIPDRSEYTHCLGLFTNWNSPAITGRQTVLKIIMWLRSLARITDDESILKAALYLADKYIQPHRDTVGEIKLFKELDEIKHRFHIHYHTEDVNKLKSFCKDHFHIPDIIREYLAIHETVVLIINWLNTICEEADHDGIIQASVYLADKYLHNHRTTVDEIELYNVLESFKSSHGIQYSKSNIKDLRTYLNEQIHQPIPIEIGRYLETHEVAWEISHWLSELRRSTNDKHVQNGAYHVVRKYLKEHKNTPGNIELYEKLKHSKKIHMLHWRYSDKHALVDYLHHHDHHELPDVLADSIPEYQVYAAKIS